MFHSLVARMRVCKGWVRGVLASMVVLCVVLSSHPVAAMTISHASGQRSFQQTGVVIKTALQLDRSSVQRGGTVTGRVTYANTGPTSVTLRDIVIVSVPPGGTNNRQAFSLRPTRGTVQLRAGTEVTLIAQRTIQANDPYGTWTAYSTYQDYAGSWRDSPAASSVSFTVVSNGASTTPTPRTALPTATPRGPSPTLAPTSRPTNTPQRPTTPVATARPTNTVQPTATSKPVVKADVTIRIDRSRPDIVSQLAVGVTHTKEGLNATGDPASRARAIDYLSKGVRYENRHIYGWGADNPNPAPGVYDWTDLDALVATSRASGTELVLTIGMAPDWMTTEPAPTGTNEPRYNRAPLPQHYDAFAELARQVALRYPSVRYYQVWNEMKGFSFPYGDYTPMYNKVYDALKSVDPSLQVGGFYLTLVGNSGNPTAPLAKWELDIIRNWLHASHGADFICVDSAVVFYNAPVPALDTILAGTARYEYMTRQIRSLTTLPIWWSSTLR